MNTISGTASLVAALREAANYQPSPSIADVVGSPGAAGLESIDPRDFAQRYEVGVLANTLRANADMQLALIQMIARPDSPVR
jgi:hypothetical protein